MWPLPRMALSLALPLLGLIGLCVFADELDVLHINPFKRPLLEQSVPSGNPVSAKSEAEPPPQTLMLEATLLAGRTSLARINGKIVGIGDAIEGYRVTSIRSGQVTLTKGDQPLVLHLEQQSSSQAEP